ncbi:MAG TPA: hypothetical protein VFR73_10715 [Hyphomicrobiaceae bacterium]|nr:hypothetical protein [Hyphomicrobiaceae bacterium]
MTFVVTGIAGVSIGLRFRVAALIAASILVAIIGVAASLLRGVLAVAAFPVMLALAALHIGYVVGLLASCRRGVRSAPTAD